MKTTQPQQAPLNKLDKLANLSSRLKILLLILGISILALAAVFIYNQKKANENTSKTSTTSTSKEPKRIQVGATGIIEKIDAEKKLITLANNDPKIKEKLILKVDSSTEYRVEAVFPLKIEPDEQKKLAYGFADLKVGQRISVLTQEDIESEGSLKVRIISLIYPLNNK